MLQGGIVEPRPDFLTSRLLDRLLPARVLETGGPEGRSRARLLAGVSILFVVVGAIGAWVAEQGDVPSAVDLL
ncbi:MAG: hypothetical protein GY937_24650 [bacterium]|nr:hypothetical protein [bacterium]